MRSIKTSVVGTAALTREDIAPALLALKGRLMERNVAENIAERCGATSGVLLAYCLAALEKMRAISEQVCLARRPHFAPS